ncbi:MULTISPECIES: ester cyclase [Chryseobacterium]|uniref:Ester cyclase n=1 Tax=Chryseobacterium camelliae TaxID=1265445 RepID=A0ABU0TE57_9FLAO|nr:MULTISPECIES: ester cyclase [Chryseobacterium]MDT3406849.1 putative ester cyclase [Pseudacidovorax intermedius]MDQ1095355.1 putative ester cyclase [Chryseobacterium camelliae]MDQ1099293.1 putative ester cyclase [Chryseobacterium sp. SORGH_AS_1048]MDR6086642.1 putative ester cyclase [Chryseobacterium sp. SORGH_AS_0909]MDR6131014.1 putative ester cyclase [Chryseobacterium sp. SORGH_AS_1175]
MHTLTERNKEVVRRFNTEVIEKCDEQSLDELMDENFVNHSAPEGADNGPSGMMNTFKNILHRGLPDLTVVIDDQIAEGDLVTTRKQIIGTHTGVLMDIQPTGRKVAIDVIDIVKIKDGKYIEYWGVNTLPLVMAQLKNQG